MDDFYQSRNITMCPDGKYRWVYELDMYKSSVIIKELWRVLLISGAIVLAFLFVLNIMDNDLLETLQFIAQVAAILFGIFLVLSIIGYLIFAYIVGGKYCVVFEMDEYGINHKQHDKHVKKSELIGALTVFAGLAGGNLGTVGTGVLAAARTSMYTGFDDVKELEILPKEHLIRVNETLSRNQVYAEDEDFVFVANYIKARCCNAKVKGEAFVNAMPQQPGMGRQQAMQQRYGAEQNSMPMRPEEEEYQRTMQQQYEAEQQWAMQEQNAAPRFCSNCGAKLNPGSKFCPNCGAKV